MTMRRRLLLALPLSLIPVMPLAAADPSAQQFLERIYAHYTGNGAPGLPLDTPTAIRQYFDPPLAALILADQARSAQRDEPPALDGDPFVDAQDWLITDLTVSVTLTDPQNAIGSVSFTNLDKPLAVRVALVRLPAGWRVHEITYPHTTLTHLLLAPDA
jgi:hypothetical protein